MKQGSRDVSVGIYFFYIFGRHTTCVYVPYKGPLVALGLFFFAFVALLKNQQHPTYGLGKVRTTGGSDNTTRRTEENHRTGEMGGEWVRAAGWGGVVYSMALCSCGFFS